MLKYPREMMGRGARGILALFSKVGLVSGLRECACKGIHIPSPHPLATPELQPWFNSSDCLLLFLVLTLSHQEIDGNALLLLKSDMVMKYLGLKLGPALKLCYHIDRLKQAKF